jgi:N-hydroxyarylamine O-acetyltransferase
MNYALLTNDELERYFQRIGFLADAGADLATLQALHRLHPQALAFESLDSWCGRTPSLVPDEVFAKLVAGQRGGYCFEQNQLFLRVLLTLGFRVHPLAARVILPDRPAPRTHMVLLVETADTQWLADVGFGGMTMTAPLQLHALGSQPTPHEPWQLQAVDDEFVVSALVENEWQAKFSFGLARQIAEDYEMANWVIANWPPSRFRHDLIAARPDAAGRHALLNTRLSYHRHGLPSQHQELTSPAATLLALQQVFGINTAGIDGLEQRVAKLFATS